MSLLDPLWMLWLDVPLAVLAGLLWWSVSHMEPPLPLDEEARRYRPTPRPITRDFVFAPGQQWPVDGITASSAVGVIATSAFGPPR